MRNSRHKSAASRNPRLNESLDRAITYRLHLLSKLTDHVSQQAYRQETGMSISDGRCLATIGSFEPLSIMDLARLGNLNKGQASRAAQTLVDLGLVLKDDSPDDGRGVVLTLTPAGREMWERTMDLIRLRNEQICGCLNSHERQTLSALLDRLIEYARPTSEST